MKQKLNLRGAEGVLVPTAVLTIICLVTALLLGLSNALTKDRIAALQVEAARTSRLEVLPEADDFTDLGNADLVAKYNLVDYYVANNGAGAAITAQAVGYSSTPIQVMVGIDAEGNVISAKILQSDETPGLGLKTSDRSYLDQYTGKNGANGELSVIKSGTPGESEILSVAGASTSSRAVTLAVNNALKAFAEGGIA